MCLVQGSHDLEASQSCQHPLTAPFSLACPVSKILSLKPVLLTSRKHFSCVFSDISEVKSCAESNSLKTSSFVASVTSIWHVETPDCDLPCSRRSYEQLACSPGGLLRSLTLSLYSLGLQIQQSPFINAFTQNPCGEKQVRVSLGGG